MCELIVVIIPDPYFNQIMITYSIQ